MSMGRTIRRRLGASGGDGGVVDVQVGAAPDDGWSMSDGTFHDGASPSTQVVVGNVTAGTRDGYAWWDNVTVPQGVSIDAASIEVQADRTDLDGSGMLTNLCFEDSDDAVAPTTRAEHVADARTTAFSAWDDEDFVVDAWTTSPDISAAVKEVVDRGSWVSGNAMMLLWDDDGSPVQRIYGLKAYDLSASLAIKLHIEWSA